MRGSEVSLLLSLKGDESLRDVAEKAGLSESYVSEIVSGLDAKGLVTTRRAGKRKLVSPAQNEAVELLRRTSHLYPHIDLPAILSGEAVPILYQLDESKTVAQLAQETDNYRNTVHRTLKRLQTRGIVRKEDSHYDLNEDLEILREFAEAYTHLKHRRKTSRHVDRFAILWEDLNRFLVKTFQEIEAENFHETGPRLLTRYDLPLLTKDEYHYLYDEGTVELRDLVCHLLLINTGTRSHTYGLLLILKENIDTKKLTETAETYGVKDRIQEMLTYLETKGGVRGQSLPEWREFEETATEYGVAT